MLQKIVRDGAVKLQVKGAICSFFFTMQVGTFELIVRSNKQF